MDERLTLRVRMPDGSTRLQPVVFKPDVCREEGDDETGLVDTVAAIDPAARASSCSWTGSRSRRSSRPGNPRRRRTSGSTAGEWRARQTGMAHPPAAPSSRGTTRRSRGAAAGGGEAAPRYAVQASTDGGRTWTTLAVGTTDTSLELDPEPFSDAEQVRFRVLTTNGFLQTVATTEDMAVDTL